MTTIPGVPVLVGIVALALGLSSPAVEFLSACECYVQAVERTERDLRGVPGMDISEAQKREFETRIRAVLREYKESACGNLRTMLRFVSESPEELAMLAEE